MTIPDRIATRHAETRRAAIDAAWDLAREQGLAGFSLRDLAGRLGMRAPSLYQYFSGKHAIYDAMFVDGNRQLTEEMDPLRHLHAGARDRLTAVVRRFIRFCSADETRFQLLFQNAVPGWQPSPDAYAPAVANYEAMADYLADCGIEDRAAMDLWTALVSGLAHQQVANDPGGDRWELLAGQAVDMYLTHIEGGNR